MHVQSAAAGYAAVHRLDRGDNGGRIGFGKKLLLDRLRGRLGIGDHRDAGRLHRPHRLDDHLRHFVVDRLLGDEHQIRLIGEQRELVAKRNQDRAGPRFGREVTFGRRKHECIDALVLERRLQRGRAADLRDLDVGLGVEAAFGREPAGGGFLGAADGGDADRRVFQGGNALLQGIAGFHTGFFQKGRCDHDLGRYLRHQVVDNLERLTFCHGSQRRLRSDRGEIGVASIQGRQGCRIAAGRHQHRRSQSFGSKRVQCAGPPHREEA